MFPYEDAAPGGNDGGNDDGNDGDDDDETGHCPLWIRVRWDFHARCQVEWAVACLRSTFGRRRTFLYTANFPEPTERTFGSFYKLGQVESFLALLQSSFRSVVDFDLASDDDCLCQ